MNIPGTNKCRKPVSFKVYFESSKDYSYTHVDDYNKL